MEAALEFFAWLLANQDALLFVAGCFLLLILFCGAMDA